jgi:nucleoside-diphosphate-sugar epimerase
MTLANPIRLPLCEYNDALGRQSLSAVIDELTLTYCVVHRESLPLRKHLPSLQEARRWHDVIGLSRSPRPSADAQHLAADVLDADALFAPVRSATPDAVVHLATAIPDPVNPRHNARDMACTNRLRTEGTANLIVAARAAGAGRIVAHSLAYAYDPAAAAICSEDRPL